MIYDWSEHRIREAVLQNFTYTGVLRSLGVPIRGNNLATLKRRINLYNIDISHFTFSPKRRGKKKLESYLVNGEYHSPTMLKNRLLKEGYKNNTCEVCGISEWNGKTLGMQLHHIDGNILNNCLENLILICPNCHAQTYNFRGFANKKKEKEFGCCQDCGRKIGKTAVRCPSCAAKKRTHGMAKITMTAEEYKKYKEMGYPNTQIARIYGVTETAIRKWRRATFS